MGNSQSYGSSTKAENVAPDVDLSGKVAVVTGANTGIGKETSRVLALRGARVIMVCRNEERAKAAVAQLRASTGKGEEEIEYMLCDLGSLKSVDAFVAAYKERDLPLHILVNNAGIMALPAYEETEDGVERQWGTNHLAHFHLTVGLADVLRRSAPARVVCLSSTAHKYAPAWNTVKLPPTREGYKDWAAYGVSKFSNLLFAREFNARFSGDGVTAYAVHPGVIATELTRYNSGAKFFFTISRPFLKSVPQGAATSVYCATQPGLEKEAGEYFADCGKARARDDAYEPDHARRLWEVSEELVKSILHGETAE